MADISNDLLDKLNIDGSLSAKEFAHMILFENDTSDIDEIRRNFKKNFLDKFKKELDKIKTKDIKQIFDPLNLSDVLKDPESLRDELKEYKNKLRKELRKAKKKLDDGALDLGSQFGLNLSSKTGTEEQKTFGEKPIKIEFSKETNDFLTNLFLKFSLTNDKKIKQEETEDKDTKSGFSLLDLITLGVGGGLLAWYWNSHVRPYLEQKFDFLDRLKGIFNAIEKFIYTSVAGFFSKVLLGITQVLSSIKNIVSLGVKGITGIFTKPIAEAGAKAGSKAAAELAAKTGTKVAESVAVDVGADLAAKAAPGAAKAGVMASLKGFGKALFSLAKGLPIVGAFVSGYFAYQRFMEGDTVGGFIDIVGAIGSLLTATVIGAPLGTALSWGALALNAFFDLTAEGNTPEEKSASKLNSIKTWLKAPFKLIANLPIVKSFMNFGEGLYKFLDGAISGSTSDTISGLKLLQKSFFSPVADILIPIYEDNVQIDNKTGTKSFDWSNIYKQWTAKILKKTLPDWLYDMVAPYIIGDTTSTVEPIDKSKLTNKVDVLNSRVSTNKQIDELSSLKYEDKEREKERITNLEILKQNIKALDEVDAELAKQSTINRKKDKQEDTNAWPKAKINDGEAEIKIGQNRIKVNPQDTINLIASKPDGAFSDVFKNLGTGFEQMVKEMKSLSVILKENSNNKNSFVSVQGSGNNINPFTIMDDGPLRSRRSYLSTTPRVI